MSDSETGTFVIACIFFLIKEATTFDRSVTQALELTRNKHRYAVLMCSASQKWHAPQLVVLRKAQLGIKLPFSLSVCVCLEGDVFVARFSR